MDKRKVYLYIDESGDVSFYAKKSKLELEKASEFKTDGYRNKKSNL